MKYLLPIIIVLFSYSASFTQTWTSAGYFPTPVFAFGEKGNVLYAGCSTPSPAQPTSKLLYRLNNGVFEVDNSFTNYSSNGFIMAIKEFKGELFVGGNFAGLFGPNPVYALAKENGGAWVPVGSGFGAFDFIFSLEVYNDRLYAAGIFTNAGGIVTNGIAAWDGNNWAAVAGAGLGTNGGIYTMKVFNNELYVAGSFTSIGGMPVNNIAKWNDSLWFPLSTGLFNSSYSRVTALEVYKNELYAAGIFDIAGGDTIHALARWSNNKWKDAGVGTFTDVINDIEEHQGELYVTGHFPSIGGVTAGNIARWNGLQWSDLGPGIYGNTPAGSALFTRPDGLYVGGFFEKAGGITVTNAARWDASPDAVEKNHQLSGVTLYPIPATDEVSVKPDNSEPMHFSIYDIKGQLVISENLSRDGKIDVRSLSAGVFLIKCEQTSGTTFKRFVIMR